jgi:hypothetical protein
LPRFRSPLKPPLLKYSRKAGVLLRHCSVEFMKHVLPRFCRPTTPVEGGAWASVTTFSMSPADACRPYEPYE